MVLPRPWIYFAMIGLYLAYAVAMTVAQPHFLYPFSRAEIALQVYDRMLVEVPGVDPVRVVVTGTGSGADAVVLYFMGNAGNIAYFIPSLNQHHQAGRLVVAMEYRGGGGLPGRPSEARLKADALAVHDWASARYGNGKPLIVHGYSLGTGLAVHVAARRPTAGVILDAPFARICELMQRAALLPACHMPGVEKWDNLGEAQALAGQRVAILHGAQDRDIPIAEGRRLEAGLREAGAEVVFHEIAEGTHGNLPRLPAYRQALEGAIAGFLETP